MGFEVFIQFFPHGLADRAEGGRVGKRLQFGENRRRYPNFRELRANARVDPRSRLCARSVARPRHHRPSFTLGEMPWDVLAGDEVGKGEAV